MSSVFDMTNKQKATHKHVGKLVGVYIESKAFHDANPGLTEEECAALIPLICIFAGINEQDAPNDEVFLKVLHTYLTRYSKDNSTENVDSFFDKAATVKIVSAEGIDSVAPDDWAKHVTAMRKKYADMSEHLYSIKQDELKAQASEKWSVSDIKWVRDIFDSYIMNGCGSVYHRHNPAFTPDFECHILWPLLALWHGPPYDVGRDDYKLYKTMHEYMTAHGKDDLEEIDGVFNFAAKMEFVKDEETLAMEAPDDPEDWAKFVKVERGKYELFRSQLGY